MNELQEHLKVLRAAAAGTLPEEITHDSPEISYDAFRRLHEAGMLTATKRQFLKDLQPKFLEAKLSLAGVEYLAQLEKQSMPDQATKPTADVINPVKDRRQKLLVHIAIGALIVVIGTAAVAFLKIYFGLPL